MRYECQTCGYPWQSADWRPPFCCPMGCGMVDADDAAAKCREYKDEEHGNMWASACELCAEGIEEMKR